MKKIALLADGWRRYVIYSLVGVSWEALKSWDWMCACIFTTPTEPGVRIQSLTKANMR